MGTNRRSRRRSAARILNPSLQSKRIKTSSEHEEDTHDDIFPPPDSPDTSPQDDASNHTRNTSSLLENVDTSTLLGMRTTNSDTINVTISNDLGKHDNSNPSSPQLRFVPLN